MVPAKLIEPCISSWGRPARDLRSAFLSDVEKRVGKAAACEVKTAAETEPLHRLAQVWNRIPWIEKPSDLFAPDWCLAVEHLPLSDLADHAFGAPLEAGLLLDRFRTSRCGLKDAYTLLTAIPWLYHVRGCNRVAHDLLETGLAVMTCKDAELAHSLCSSVRGASVQCRQLGRLRR